MRRRRVRVEVSDHAVLRWLERAQGLDVEAVRQIIAGKVITGAEFAALAVQVDKVRYMLVDQAGEDDVVVVTTVLPNTRRDRYQRGRGNG